jgi:hypothetical protein
MISIQETVEELLKNDYRAYCAMRLGYLNLSAYARMIHARVEELTKKTVKKFKDFFSNIAKHDNTCNNFI